MELHLSCIDPSICRSTATMKSGVTKASVSIRGMTSCFNKISVLNHSYSLLKSPLPQVPPNVEKKIQQGLFWRVDECERRCSSIAFNPFSAWVQNFPGRTRSRIFQRKLGPEFYRENWVNTLATESLATEARPSATIVLTVWDIKVLIFCRKSLKTFCAISCRRIIKNSQTYWYILLKNTLKS